MGNEKAPAPAYALPSGWVISSVSTGLDSGWARAAQGPKLKIPLPISFVPRPIENTCWVSSTSAQRFWNLRVLKMLTPHGPTHWHLTGFTRWLKRLNKNRTRASVVEGVDVMWWRRQCRPDESPTHLIFRRHRKEPGVCARVGRRTAGRCSPETATTPRHLPPTAAPPAGSYWDQVPSYWFAAGQPWTSGRRTRSTTWRFGEMKNASCASELLLTYRLCCRDWTVNIHVQATRVGFVNQETLGIMAAVSHHTLSVCPGRLSLSSFRGR